jgi:hypothetical protein
MGSRRVDARGATSILTYTLLLVVVVLLVSGLLIGVGGFVERQQERAVRSQLDTVGNRLASDLATADRLAGPAGGDQIRLQSPLPETVGNARYRIDVRNVSGDRSRLVLRSQNPDVLTTVTVRTTLPVEGNVTGGAVWVEYDGGRLEVTDG